MIKSIRIENFKSFGKLQDIPLGNITLIYGPNSAGKSSIIQSILLMRQSILLDAASLSENRVVFRGDEVDLGNYRSAVYKHEVDRGIGIGFTIDPSKNTSNRYVNKRNIENNSINIDIKIKPIFDGEHDYPKAVPKKNSRQDDARKDDAWIEDFIIGSSPKKIHLHREKIGVPPDGFVDINYNFKIKNIISYDNLINAISVYENEQIDPKEIKKHMGSNWKNLNFGTVQSMPSFVHMDEDLVSKIRGLLENFRLFSSLMRISPINDARENFIAALSNVSYLGPLRSPPARHYIVSGNDRGSVGQRGERMPQLLYRRKSILLRRLNEILQQFDIPYSVNVEGVGTPLTGDIIAMSLTDARGVEVSPSDVGFGIGQLMPILVEGAVSTGKLICVEQPEIHIHPRIQGHLADFFVNTSVVQGKPKQTGKSELLGGNQWIVETHSEALILRFQTLINKKLIPHDFVKVLYIQPTDEGAQVIHLRMNSDGDFIDDWPEGFFEESFQEIFVNRR